MSLPEPCSTVTIGRIDYTVMRSGCATDWAECPHRNPVTVRRVKGCQLTECHDWKS